jgi:hypothetical protein
MMVFNTPLNKAFRNKVLMEGITKKDVNVLENPDYLAINN